MTNTRSGEAWPVALEREIGSAGLARASLYGTELVIWRSSAGAIHVWDDRCPHRSIRLSAGRNLGDDLQCVYHGWCFATDGGVSDIPAQRNEPPPKVSAKIRSSIVSNGHVWVSMHGAAPTPDESPWAGLAFPLRPMEISVPAAQVQAVLPHASNVRFHVTPSAADWCTVFGHVQTVPGESEVRCLKRFDRELTRLRRMLEDGAKR